VFDVLKLRGRELFSVDVVERKRMLAELIGAGGEAIRYVDHLVGSGPKLFAHAYSLGIEGIVSKRVGSGYRPGERSSRWQKVKCYHVQRMTVARIGDGDVAVVDDDGAHAGWVPVYSRLRLAALRPGDAVTVKALARRAGRMLRHATLLAEDAESVISP
jgi:ATP-dependent DNA ligase